MQFERSLGKGKQFITTEPFSSTARAILEKFRFASVMDTRFFISTHIGDASWKTGQIIIKL
ncbi:MAG: hypothetical protein JEY71_07895 [Sphaerochaeta sp.]|nr:hypothetical protein [Sphaerochaeta sp.]